MKKLLCIVGTRPQLIKHAALLSALQTSFQVETINTVQHYQYELNELLKNDLSIKNVIDLPQKSYDDPVHRLANMLNDLSAFLKNHSPDAVLVYGDTDSTLAGALTAKKHNRRLIHIEAGERSYNNQMPEEINRIITDSVSDILFCASKNAYNNLKKEKNRNKFLYSGDLMKDLLLTTSAPLNSPLINHRYIFCTIHRDYNKHNAEKLQQLLNGLEMLSHKIIFSLHPVTLNTLQQIKYIDRNDKFQFLPPLSYTKSVHYQKFAEAVITDSGGMQKEAYWLKTPCITVRKETEWIDTLKGNWNQLLYDDLSKLSESLNIKKGKHNPLLYGDGTAGKFITDNLLQIL
jgi:UDP-GlcNAc3NAcA epimerase